MSGRTQLISRRHLERLLSGAIAAGDQRTLYWFVEMRISPSLAGTREPVLSACSYPVGWVPVVPVGDDPVASRHYADLLLECLKSGNRGRLIEFGMALTTTDVIVDGGFQIHEWGDACWDCVCVECGGVWRSTTAGEEICEACRVKPGANRKG